MNTGTETLQNPFLKSCKKPGFRQQFGRPHGRLGSLVGHLMAVKNRKVKSSRSIAFTIGRSPSSTSRKSGACSVQADCWC